jgi:hypothetical protein
LQLPSRLLSCCWRKRQIVCFTLNSGGHLLLWYSPIHTHNSNFVENFFHIDHDGIWCF